MISILYLVQTWSQTLFESTRHMRCGLAMEIRSPESDCNIPSLLWGECKLQSEDKTSEKSTYSPLAAAVVNFSSKWWVLIAQVTGSKLLLLLGAFPVEFSSICCFIIACLQTGGTNFVWRQGDSTVLWITPRKHWRLSGMAWQQCFIFWDHVLCICNWNFVCCGWPSTVFACCGEGVVVFGCLAARAERRAFVFNHNS